MGSIRAVAGFLLVSLAVVTFGAAASLNLSATSLGAAQVATPRCTAAGLTVFQNLAVGNVVSVTVGGIPATCGGATLQVTVNNGSANSSGSATVAAGGGSSTVILAAGVPVTATEQTDLVMVGP